MTDFNFCEVFVFLFLCSGGIGNIYSQEEVIDLWEKGVPGAIESKDYKEEYRRDAEGNITGIRKGLPLLFSNQRKTKGMGPL